MLAPWAYIASVLYHDSFWYPRNAKRLMQDVLASPWGRLFRNWETVQADGRGYPDVGTDVAQIEKTGAKAFYESIGILGPCIQEAPEFGSRRRKQVAAAAKRAAAPAGPARARSARRPSAGA